jgi:hypothetical protein
MKNEGGRRLATGLRWFRTVAIDVYLLFLNFFVVVSLFIIHRHGCGRAGEGGVQCLTTTFLFVSSR